MKEVAQRDEDLVISLDVIADEDPDLPQNVRITCESYCESKLAPRHYSSLYHYQDHVLLWDYNQPRVVASFYGKVKDPLAVTGALYERHVELVERWIPFSKYLNPCLSLSQLIGGSFGMLAEGPQPLILAYEEVMASYGVSISHHESNSIYPIYDDTLSVLIMDESYVIAKRFHTEAI